MPEGQIGQCAGGPVGVGAVYATSPPDKAEQAKTKAGPRGRRKKPSARREPEQERPRDAYDVLGRLADACRRAYRGR